MGSLPKVGYLGPSPNSRSTRRTLPRLRGSPKSTYTTIDHVTRVNLPEGLMGKGVLSVVQ